MTQSAKAQEPSMEEILASIRRIIADDDAAKATKPQDVPAPKPAPAAPPPPPAAAAPPPPPRPVMPPPPAPKPASQDDIDAMLAEIEPPKAPPPRPAPKPAGPPPDVFELTEAMAQPTPSPGPAPSFRTIDGVSDVVFTDRPPEVAEPPPAPPSRAAEDPRRAFAPAPTPASTLLSRTSAAAVDQAFNTLAQTMLVNNARTLEDLVKDMLRPMLKTWLDDNLPGLVERIVRAEIERVSRGRP